MRVFVIPIAGHGVVISSSDQCPTTIYSDEGVGKIVRGLQMHGYRNVFVTPEISLAECNFSIQPENSED